MTHDEITKAIFSVVPQDEVVSIFTTGMTDNSLLSDIDVVVVTNKEKTIRVHGLDIRGCYTRETFAEALPYLPHAHLTCIYGNDVQADFSQAGNKTIKLAYLFYTSFLRNLYRDTTAGSVAQSLIDLNDFEYAAAWLSEQPVQLMPFLTKVRAARDIYPTVSADTVRALLFQGIDLSWEIIELLNAQLVALLPEVSMRRYYGKEPTVFTNTPSAARTLTDKHLRLVRATKVLALPDGFARIHSTATDTASQYAQHYLQKNTRSQTFRAQCKHGIKYIVARFFFS